MPAASDRIRITLDRMLALHPRVIDLSLGRIERLLAALGHPERRLPPVVHVAGTNGKGSTLAFLRAGLEAAGQRVHVYTSPHLVRFNERILLAGAMIGDGPLADLLDEVEAVNGGAEITFFEITTAAAFLAFARVPADALLLETGLGGRLDATNVVAAPRLTVITPVGIDHQSYLGDTLPKIAAEKAGIVKPGAPCVVAPQDPAALAVIREAATRLGVPTIEAGRDWSVAMEAGGLRYRGPRWSLDLPPPVLAGAHQATNAGTAVACLEQLAGADFPAAAPAAAMTRATWPARLQRLTGGPLVARLSAGLSLWLDGAHNRQAAEALADWVAGRGEPVDIVAGLLDTKDSDAFFRAFAGKVRRVRTVLIPDTVASRSAEDTAAAARAAGLDAAPAASVEAALASLVDAAGTGPAATVLICGSLYLAGSVLATVPVEAATAA